MHDYPKQSYNVNESESLSGGSIKVTRATGTPEIIDLTDERVNVSGFDSSEENSNLPITVRFTENGITPESTGYSIRVQDSVTAMEIKTEPKTEYRYNEELDLSDGILEVTSGSGTIEVPMNRAQITGYNKEELGEQTINVTYGGITKTFKVTVKDYVTGITVNPNEVTGRYNEELSSIITSNSITYTVTYAKAGAQTPTDLLDTMVIGYSSTNRETQNLKVQYIDTNINSASKGETFEADLAIILENAVATVSITKPTKDKYNHGEGLDLTTGIITITYEDGTTREIPITEDMVTEDGNSVDMSPTSYDSTNKVQKTLIIRYSKDGKTDTINYPIEIINDVKSIVIKTKPKDEYNVGDTEDLSGGEITVTRAIGTEDIPLTDARVEVTGFDSSEENTRLPITVKFTENGMIESTSYEISVIDNVLDVVIENIPKTAYQYGEELDVSAGTLKVTKGSGETIIPIKPNMVTEADGSPFDGTNLGTRNLNVTYGGKILTYEITVSDYVLGIKVTPPDKIKYEYGESLDLTGGKVQKIMASGTPTTPVELEHSDVTLSTFNPNEEGVQNIEVTYAGCTDSFVVTVEDNVQSIQMNQTPKTAYKYGESLEVVGGTIIATKSSGQTEVVNITESMVSGYSPNVLGDKDLTVTYKGKTTQYTINVADYVKDIEIEKPTKLVYKLDEPIDLTGGYVKKIMASGASSEKVSMSNETVTIQGFDTSKEGSNTIKVTYQGFTKTFGITVIDSISNIYIKTLPNKLEYRYGESLNLEGGTIEIIKESGESTIEKITKDMVSGFNPKKLGNQTLTLTYNGIEVSGEIIVKVTDYVSHLKVTTPAKTEYEYGEYLDLSKGKVAIIMASGAVQEEVDMTASMLTGYNLKQEGKQNIQVEYKNLKGNFNITVIDKIKAIEIEKEPNKVGYEYGEKLDVTGAKIKVFKSSGEIIIDVTDQMVSGYEPQKAGTQMITVTYQGFTAKFIVTVHEKVQATVKRNVVTQKESLQEEPVQEEVTPEPVQEPTKVEESKPTETLGVKDEKKDFDKDKLVAIGLGLAGLLLLLLLFLTKRNVKIYVEEDGKFELGGLDKISKKKLSIDVDKYLDGDTYQNRAKVKLSDAISEKLDGQVIEIKHRGKINKYTIEYKDEPFEIVLK